MEILQHGITGELYAMQYRDGMTQALLSGVAGPLTTQEALRTIDSGEFPDGTEEDIEWALNQPWSEWRGEALARADA